MSSDSSLESLVRSSVSEIFPEFDMQYDLLPLLDLSLGQLGTDVCLLLAAQYKESPQTIGEKLIPELGRKCPAKIALNSGFLNFDIRLESLSLLDIKYCAEEKGSNYIFVTPRTQNLSEGEYARLLALAHCQALHSVLHGNDVVFEVAERKERFYSIQQVVNSFELSIKTLIASAGMACTPGDVAGRIESFVKEYKKEKCFIWLTPRTLERDVYSQLYNDYKNRGTNFRCPPQSFFSGTKLDHSLISSENNLNFLMYLASNCTGADFDTHVPTMSENANILWHAESVVQRAANAGFSMDNRISKQELISYDFVDDCLNRALVRAFQMKRFSLFASEKGRVLEWSDAFADLLGAVDSILNQPDIRISLSSNKISDVHCKIITGVLKSVSDMIGLWKEGGHHHLAEE